jgi:hypothetical protein
VLYSGEGKASVVGWRGSDPVAASRLYGDISGTRGATSISVAERTDDTIPLIEVVSVLVGILKGGGPDAPAGFTEYVESMACR